MLKFMCEILTTDQKVNQRLKGLPGWNISYREIAKLKTPLDYMYSNQMMGQ
jgi:hypothetical protein